MRARDRDAVLEPHQLREHLGARDDRDALARRFDNLSILQLNRRAHDDHIGVVDVFFAVPIRDARPLRGGSGTARCKLRQRQLDVARQALDQPVFSS